tara:strand:+ start:207 stop:443 length:237 start_codon:yes stop_codon:yes gene_type:complete
MGFPANNNENTFKKEGTQILKVEFQHINYASDDVEGLNDFYVNILKMDPIPTQNFIRTTATQNSGYDGKILFSTEGNI